MLKKLFFTLALFSFSTFTNLSFANDLFGPSGIYLDMGGGDLLSPSGDLLLDIGGGDKIGSDGLYLNIGDGDLLTPSGELLFK